MAGLIFGCLRKQSFLESQAQMWNNIFANFSCFSSGYGYEDIMSNLLAGMIVQDGKGWRFITCKGILAIPSSIPYLEFERVCFEFSLRAGYNGIAVFD